MSAKQAAGYVDFARKQTDPLWPVNVETPDAFTAGWAVVPFIHRPHYWQRSTPERLYVALCGVRNDLRGAHRGVNPLASDGTDRDACQNCHQTLRRKARLIRAGVAS